MKRDTVVTCIESNHNRKMMTTVLDGSYQQLDSSSEDKGEAREDNHEETPEDSDVMIHVVPESGKSRWNHIEDLDSFFTRVYHYHQKHGFTCMMVKEFFELLVIIFVVIAPTYLFHCVDFSILFKDKVLVNNDNKISLSDAIISPGECLASMGLVAWIFILIASIFWFLRAIKAFYHFIQFWDIKSFFNVALKINDDELDNLTWHEVQKRVIEVQKEQEMCIHKRDLTELDIYHRILRFTNYMVAMVNKSLLPVRLKTPLFGDIIFMTRGLKYNLELILFWGPWSPFENNWHLREDYKKLIKRQELARSLSKHILWIGIANFILSPFVCLWQTLYYFLYYVELLKRDPGTLGLRMWSLYGRLYMRHFNELDHELNARLNRAYRPASKYMNMFTSPLAVVIAENVAFISGSVCAVFFMIGVYDEDFFTVQHVLMIIAITGATFKICRTLIPDENLVWCPESLLTAVLAHTHYRPDSWRNQAHTHATRAQVAQLFQYKAVHLFEELVSPLLTPYILCFQLRYRALDIVDFYRNFTIEVTGVGDVCSFAQMDVKKHGNPMWQTLQSPSVKEKEMFGFENFGLEQNDKNISLLSNQYTQAENGKTELSLIHFTLTNPEWKPPSHAENFVMTLRERAKREAMTTAYLDTNPLYASLNSLSSLGPEYNDIILHLRNTMVNQSSMQSVSRTLGNYTRQPEGMCPNTSSVGQSGCINIDETNRSETTTKAVRRGVSKAEGPLHFGERSLLYSLQEVSNQSLGASILASGHQDINTKPTTPLELTTFDMSLSTLYLHELHHRQVRRRGYREAGTRSIWQRNPPQELATLPELGQERAPLLLHQDSSIRSKRDT